MIHMWWSLGVLNALIHFATWSHDPIRCYWSDLNLTSASGRVLSQIGIQHALFPSDSVYRVASEIMYHIWHTPPFYRLFKTDCWLWPFKPRLPLQAQYIKCFLASLLTSLYKCWWCYYLYFFLFTLAQRILCYQLCVFFIGAGVCQSVVVCPSMLTMSPTFALPSFAVWMCSSTCHQILLDILPGHMTESESRSGY